MMEINPIELAKKIRTSVLDLAYQSGRNGSHIGGALSCVEIFAVLYSEVMNFDLNNPEMESRDRLIVSKGHCVSAYYSALFYAGLISKDELESFETNGSAFHGHATRNLTKGIEFSGGSLSMGLSYAVGVAIANKKKGNNTRVFAIVGDGECDEGLIWESAMSASNFMLNNLIVIVDCNGLQYDGDTQKVMNSGSLAKKFEAFNFDVYEIDGHNVEQLSQALSEESQKPKAVIAHTIKGKGVSFMENQKQWHHSTLSKDLYDKAIGEQL